MLDVHPPHESTHTWKDFFIHIATICVGLLIAVGLEQTVEAIHHSNEVKETREALKLELEANEQQFARNTAAFRVETARFQNNLKTLVYVRSHPHTTPDQWPAPINWHNYNSQFSDAAWVTAESGQILNLIPPKEIRTNRTLYTELELIDSDRRERELAIRETRRYLTLDFDPAHLSPEELDKAIHDAEDVLAWHYRLGSEMRNLSVRRPNFTPAPTTRELVIDIMHEPDTPDNTATQWFTPDTHSKDASKPTGPQTPARGPKSGSER